MLCGRFSAAVKTTKTCPSYKSPEYLFTNTWSNHWTLTPVYFFLVASENMLLWVNLFLFSSPSQLPFSLFHVQSPGLLCCLTLGLNRKKLSEGVSFSWQKDCCHVHKFRGRLLLGAKAGLRVKLTVKSCADHQGVKSSYFNCCMFLKGFGLILWKIRKVLLMIEEMSIWKFSAGA